MIPAQLPVSLFAPLAPLFLLVGAFTIWLWGRHTTGTSGKPVAVLAVGLSAIVAAAAFVWQQTEGGLRSLGGPTLMTVPGHVAVTIDLAFTMDGLSLFWLALVSLVGVLTVWLDDNRTGREWYVWWLLSLTCAQLVLLTDNLVVLFGVWEFGWIAVWSLASQTQPGNASTQIRPPLLLLAADLPLLLAIAVCWQHFGSFHISPLIDLVSESEISANQRAALALVVYCVVAATWARCLQFPFCTWALQAGGTSRGTAGALIGTVVVPTGLYLLLRFQPLIAVEPGAWALLAGAGSLSALLWGGMALVQETLERSVLAFCSGTLGLLMAGIGCGVEFPVLLLLGASATTGCWAIRELTDVERERRQMRLASRSAATIAVVLCCGVFGQEAILNAAWPAGSIGESSQIVDTPPQPAERSTDHSPINLVLPVAMMMAHLMLALGLFRALFRFSFLARDPVRDESDPDAASDAPPTLDKPEPPRSVLTIFAVTVAGVAGAALLAVFTLWRGGGLTFAAPGMMGLLMMLALLLAGVLYARRSDGPARMESAAGGLTTLCRRSFYIDELIQWVWVLPWTVLGWLAATSDRTFFTAMDRRLRDVQAGFRQSVQESISEGPLRVYVMILIAGVALMIILLMQG